jgi:hypothetical protein
MFQGVRHTIQNLNLLVLLEGAQQNRGCEGQAGVVLLYGVPYALKLLAEIDEGLQQMARLELVMFGGSCKDGPGRT